MNSLTKSLTKFNSAQSFGPFILVYIFDIHVLVILFSPKWHHATQGHRISSQITPSSTTTGRRGLYRSWRTRGWISWATSGRWRYTCTCGILVLKNFPKLFHIFCNHDDTSCVWHLDLIKFGNSFPHILQFQECKIIWETNCKSFPYLMQLWRFLFWHFNLRNFEIAFHIYCNSRYDNRKLFKVYPSGEISYVFISDKCMQKPFLVVRSIQLQLGEGRARVWLNLGKFAK